MGHWYWSTRGRTSHFLRLIDSHSSLRGIVATGLATLLILIGVGSAAVAASESVAAKPGILWIADGANVNRLDLLARQITSSIPLPHEPQVLAVDPNDSTLWVLSYPTLIKFDADGNRVLEVDLASQNLSQTAKFLRLNPYDGSVWVAGGSSLLRLNADGKVAGLWSSAGEIEALGIDLDESIWVLTRNNLIHLSSSAALLSTLDLTDLLPDARHLAIDSLGSQITVGGSHAVLQFSLANPSKPLRRIEFPGTSTGTNSGIGGIQAIAVHPVFGTLWVINGQRLELYDRPGKFLKRVDLAPYGLGEIKNLAFDPVNLSLWISGPHVIGQFRNSGEPIDSTAIAGEVGALGVVPFKLGPSLSLVSPANDEITNNALAPIRYGVGAECAGTSCFLSADYVNSLKIDSQLNGQDISDRFAVGTSGATFIPASRLSEGANRLSSKATDRYGHASEKVASRFTVDTVAPKFISVTPTNSSSVDTPNITIQGQTDDPRATVQLEGTALIQTGANFRFAVTLRSGTNQLRLTATDPAGNVGSATLALTYNVPSTSTKNSPESGTSATTNKSRASTVSVANLVAKSATPDASTATDTDRPAEVAQDNNVENQKLAAAKAYGRLPLSFELNQGQTHDSVKFLTRGAGHAVYLTHDEAVLVLRKRNGSSRISRQVSGAPDNRHARSLSRRMANQDADVSSGPASTALRMKFIGAQAAAQVEGLEPLPTKSHYLIGNDPSKWITDVPHYAKVKHHDIYPGIDQVFYGKDGTLEYDLIVEPGIDPSQIKLAFTGAKPPTVNEGGDLVLETALGPVTHRKPFVYQEIDGERRTVASRYIVQGAEVHIAVEDYDRSLPLVIDPAVVYSTYLGGTDFQQGNAIAVGSDGSAYVTGAVSSTDFPVVNPVQGTAPPAMNAFVAKLAPDGRSLVYATYLGGNDYDFPHGIAVDTAGNAYIVGETYSTNFPKLNALQTTLKGTSDGFVTVLKPAGNAFVYSTYLGGTSDEIATSVAVDASKNAYVGGETWSTNFPTKSAYKTTAPAAGTGFLSKISATGTLTYSTYLGGTTCCDDKITGVAVDSAGSAYVTGYTGSSNFPTKTPLSGSHCPGVFVTKFVAAGNALTYSTCVNNAADDMSEPTGIVLDASNNAYITGWTYSTTFRTINAFQATKGGNASTSNAFVSKLSATGTALTFSTYLGGTADDAAYGIAVDKNNCAHVTGYAYSTNFPIVNPLSAVGRNPAFAAAFVTKFNSVGNTLAYSTFLGGTDGDQSGNGIAVDTSTNVNAYVTGGTSATNFPVINPIKATNSSQTGQAFVAKISALALPATSTSLTASATTIPQGQTVTFTATVTGNGAGGTVTFKDGSTPLATIALSGANAIYTTSTLTLGAHAITATYDGNSGNAPSTSLSINVTVNAYPTVAVTTPIASAYFMAPGTIGVAADAAVANGALSNVEFYQGTTLIGTATSSPYNIVWTNVPIGTYSLTAKATSAANLVTTSAPITVTVLDAPTISVNGLPNATTINDDTVTMTGTVQAPANSSITVNGVVGTIGQNGQFVVSNVPLTPGSNTLTITVTTPEGKTTTQTVTVNSSGQAAFALTASPNQGIAPLTVNFTLTNRNNTGYARTELSCLGNSTIDRTIPSPTTALGTCVYGTNGIYTARVKVYDNQNQVIYSGNQTIQVGSVAQQDQMLRDVYFNMLARLKVGDVAGALGYVTATTYNKYNGVFTAVSTDPNLSTTINQQLTNIKDGQMGDGYAEYLIVRNVNGEQVGHFIYLLRSEDGIWRIDEM